MSLKSNQSKSAGYDHTTPVTLRTQIMSGIPSLTILSEEQKFNGDNLLQWKTNIIQLLGSKGLLGYIDGKIPKPGPESIPLPSSETAPAQPISTPIYSSTPTVDEWTFRDQLARGR